MIFLYTLVLLLLGSAYFLCKRRVASLEKKYTRVAKEADALVRQPNYREGNSGRLSDPFAAAKRQFQLGQLAAKRDRVEARYAAWQDFTDRFGKSLGRMRNWKGRKLPYTFGVLDVAGALALIDYFGAGQYVNARALLQTVTSLFTR
jgi:hypothetical protein